MKLNNKNIEINTNESGEISSIKYEGQEILHTTGKVWGKTFPVIWPKLAVTKSFKVDGKSYDIPKHGFWNTLEWNTFMENGTLVMHALHMANDVYPFTIDIQQFISLDEDNLSIETEFANISKDVAYFHFGLHPAFAIDENSFLKSSSKKNALEISLDGKLTNNEIKLDGSISSIPFGTKFDTAVYKGVSTDTINLITKGLNLEIIHDANNLQLWKPTDADFICIEPWYGVNDIEKDSPEEAKDKEEIIALKSGERWTSKLEIKITKEKIA